MQPTHNGKPICIFEPNQIVALDAGYQTACKVIIVRFSASKMFATVRAVDDLKGKEWEVMTGRLTALK